MHHPPETHRDQPGAGRAPGPDAEAGLDSEVWRIPGLLVGLLGAAVVALIFLVFDLAAGRPMWTPSALGARLFQGRTLAPDAGWVPILALGYTLVHGVVFIGLGSIAAYMVFTKADPAAGRRPPVVAVALGLFVAFEVTFVSLALLSAPELLSRLGAGPVTVANGAAAAVMAWMLCRSPTLKGVGS